MFKVEKTLRETRGKQIKNSLGRAGVLSTSHGEILTPAFVAVGTKATVKSVSPEQVRETGSQVVLANTYHLYLEPGEKIIKESGLCHAEAGYGLAKAGGLHNFMNWSGPTMTDSGGFQAFSLGVAYGDNLSKFIGADAPESRDLEEAYSQKKERKAKITEDGVEFRSVIDGSTHFFSPEKSIQIQNDLGADIIFAFDECTSPHAKKEYLREAMERTHRWAERCLVENKKLSLKQTKKEKKSSREQLSERDWCESEGIFQQKNTPVARENLFSPFHKALFGIVQGGRYEDLRKESAGEISKMGFDGFGIGGSFVKEDMATAVKWVNEILPEEKPRHLLGVGEPIDLILGVENGCDTFDCVAPTRMARNGALYTKFGKINITNAKYKNLFEPIEEKCQCYTCKNYTAAYLSHLFRAKEMLAATLATIHNLYFLNNLMFQIRQSILDDTFFEFKEKFLRGYKN